MATQYCYFHPSGAGGASQIRSVKFNGVTYRKIKFNNTPFTISTWYSGTCINGVRTQVTYSTRSSKVTDGYAHYFTIRSQSKSGGSWVNYGAITYTTYYFDVDTDGASMSTLQGYGSYGYMSVSCYAGSETWRDCSSFTPYPASKMYLHSHSVSQRYQYDAKAMYDINFSYSTSSVANVSVFAASNYGNYYNLNNNPKVGIQVSNANYTVSGIVQGHHLFTYIQTNTF